MKRNVAAGLVAAAVAAGGVGGWAYAANGRHHSKATPPVASATSSPSGSPQPSTSPSTSSSPVLPSTTLVSLDGAQIALPQGWRAQNLDPAHQGTTSWCLLAPGQAPPASNNFNECAASFRKVGAGGDPGQLEPDIMGGIVSNPEYCSGTPTATKLLDYSPRVLGGRQADYRRWTESCPGIAQPWRIEQYVVDSAPAFVLFSDHADEATHNALAVIAASSRLPNSAGGLRLSDKGRIQTISEETGGFRIAISRVVQRAAGDFIAVDGTATYFVSSGLMSKPPAVGAVIYVATNGQQVTSAQLE